MRPPGRLKEDQGAHRGLLFLMAHEMIGGVTEERVQPRSHRRQRRVDALMRIRGDDRIDADPDLRRARLCRIQPKLDKRRRARESPS